MKDGFLKVAVCRPKIKLCDCDYNKNSIIEEAKQAVSLGAKLIVFPELCVTGATCGDLFYSDALLCGAERAAKDIAASLSDADAVVAVGLPKKHKGGVFSCAAVMQSGSILGYVPSADSRRKQLSSGIDDLSQSLVLSVCGNDDIKIGFVVGDGIGSDRQYARELCAMGATVICNLTSTPEIVCAKSRRRDFAKSESADLCAGYVLCNAGEGESTSEEVFSGHSLVCENGRVLCESALFENKMLITDIDCGRVAFERRLRGGCEICDGELTEISVNSGDVSLTRKFNKLPFVPENSAELSERCELIMSIQAQGLKRRMEHTCSKKLVIGVSGGLDSTLALIVCAKAADALGMPRKDIVAVTMPCFGTTTRTRSNAQIICEELGADFREVRISKSVEQHFEDIGHDINNHNVVFENAQARERTQVLMDIANEVGGLVVGTGDLSELALGWATYNGDHMAMYGVNASVPKTLIRYIVRYYASVCKNDTLAKSLIDIVKTPVSPELLPTNEASDKMTQITEDLVGPYELHDFFIYHALRCGYSPKKIYRVAKIAFAGEYDDAIILKWLRTFFRRFINQQFKRSCLPDGAAVGSLSLSPRGAFSMPSDACAALWLRELEEL